MLAYGRDLCAAWALVASIGSAALAQQPPAGSTSPTFNRDIAPLLYEHCAICHRPGGSAPFALISYEDVRPRARQIVSALTSRAMPPWKPTGPLGEFEGDRRLSEMQIRTIVRWSEDGAPRGKPNDLPPTPTWPNDWQLGTPDLIVRLDEPYALASGGPDQLRNFVVPLTVASTKYVRAWEFRTPNTTVVHHATLMIDRGDGARRLDAEDPDPGYQGLIPFTAQSPDGYFLGWTPGQRAQQAPPEMGWRIDPGNDLIVMLHMRPADRRELVDASVALYFSERPPSRTPVMVRLNRQDLDIPAGANSYTAVDRYTLPVDVDIYAVQPHAHYLARTIVGTARLPDGTTRSLLNIPQWDFHWQDVYHFREPVSLPAGTTLSMSIVYDNSPENRANPSLPPKRVIWGQRTTDEMGDLWLQVVPKRAQDQARLVSDLRRKILPQDMDGYRKMLEVDSRSPSLHDDLALLAIESGDLTLAINEFSISVRLQPDLPRGRYNLANALFAAGRREEARDGFIEVLRLDPNYGLAHQGLGLALAATGRVDEAAEELEAAVRLLPASSEARYNLGVLRQQQGRFDAALAAYEGAAGIDPRQADARYAAALIREARGQYRVATALLRQVLVIRPGWAQAQAELAWVLAGSPDASLRQPEESVRLARDAAQKWPRDPRALEVLAAALAAAGRYADAVQQARAALALLPAAADAARREAMARRIQLYEGEQPFRLPASPGP